jgi:hypothetical protein
MGFDWRKVRMLCGAFAVKVKSIAAFAHDDIRVVSNEGSKSKPLAEFRKEDVFAFKPHFGWIGAVEKV